MIWEVDENLDSKVDEREFYLMYKKCIEDKLHLEPNGLFLLTQFLMYCKKYLNNNNNKDIDNQSNINSISNNINNNLRNNIKREKGKYTFVPYIVSEDTYSLIYA